MTSCEGVGGWRNSATLSSPRAQRVTSRAGRAGAVTRYNECVWTLWTRSEQETWVSEGVLFVCHTITSCYWLSSHMTSAPQTRHVSWRLPANAGWGNKKQGCVVTTCTHLYTPAHNGDIRLRALSFIPLRSTHYRRPSKQTNQNPRCKHSNMATRPSHGLSLVSFISISHIKVSAH